MKNLIRLTVISFLLILITNSNLTAQDEEKVEYNQKKFQINIGVADIFAKSYWWYTDYYVNVYGDILFPYIDGNYHRQPNLVVGFKSHCNKGALRIGMNLRYSNNSYEDDDPISTKYTYGNFGTALNLGYEWHSTFGRVNVFYGFDGSFKYTQYKVESDKNGNDIINTEDYKHNESAIGISPLIGFNYFITPVLSIGTEVKFTAEYISGKSNYESTYITPYVNDIDKNEQKNSGFRTYFGPLGFLSLNIHLK